jgi:Uma2 family endonuclease
MQTLAVTRNSVLDRAKYVGTIVPLHFPESASVPESQLHLDLRTLLYQLLSAYLGETYTVGSDQFVYWDASSPKRCIAPDVYAKATPRGEPIRSWKVWERGAPDVAIEIISDSDSAHESWSEKLMAYQALGVRELVRFDLLSGGAPLRVWNRTQEVLAEREVTDTQAASLIFDLFWVVAPVHRVAQALRLASSVDPLVLVPTAEERAHLALERAELERQAKEAELQAKELERQAKEVERQAKEFERQGREVAEARVRELEALLATKQ